MVKQKEQKILMHTIPGFPKYKVEWWELDENKISKKKHFYSDSRIECWWKMRKLRNPVLMHRND